MVESAAVYSITILVFAINEVVPSGFREIVGFYLDAIVLAIAVSYLYAIMTVKQNLS